MQQDHKLEKQIINFLTKNKECSIATFNGTYVCNSVVSYYSDGLNLYFGTFDDTMKGKNLEVNSICAITIRGMQIQGVVTKLEKDSFEYILQIDQFLKKFPYYKSFFNYKNNYLYKISPLIVWIYDYKKGERYRDEFIIDYKYANELNEFYGGCIKEV